MDILLLVVFGLLIGVSLGAVGAGGSILAVPVLVYVAGESPKQATVSALVVVLLTSLFALRSHWAASRVRFDLAAPFGLAGVGGAIVGKTLSERLDANVLMLTFSGVMVLAALLMARRTRTGEPDVERPTGDGAVLVATRVASPPRLRQVNGRALAIGAGVGVMTGFFGVGGGFIIVPALVLLLGVAMPEAVGTSLAIIAFNSAVTFALKAPGVALDWSVIALFSVAAGAGAMAGGDISQRFDSVVLSRWFVRGVLVVAAYTAVRSILALG